MIKANININRHQNMYYDMPNLNLN